MAIRGVLIDFSGTLFRLEYGVGIADGLDMDGEEQARVFRILTSPVGPSTALPPDLQRDWARRDLDSDLHRRINVAALRHSGVTSTELAEAFYDRLIDPANWRPYPDTLDALKLLRTNGIPVSVVSNIAWDIRSVFRRYEAEEYVDEFVLSYVEGVIKPQPEIFAVACERIGVEPAEALMIGDSAEADGGAAALGVAVRIVDPLPVDERPHALLDALHAYGVGSRVK